jgi:hypothetical protein
MKTLGLIALVLAISANAANAQSEECAANGAFVAANATQTWVWHLSERNGALQGRLEYISWMSGGPDPIPIRSILRYATFSQVSDDGWRGMEAGMKSVQRNSRGSRKLAVVDDGLRTMVDQIVMGNPDGR